MVPVARVAVALVCLAGCSTNSALVETTPVISAPTIPFATADNAHMVEIVATGPAAKDWRNTVKATDCQRYVGAELPTNEGAVRNLRALAAERGFNTIHSVVVGPDVRSLAMNCWGAITATGIAFNDPTRPAPPAKGPKKMQ